MDAKLIFVNVPSSNIGAARRFYEALLGSAFGGVLSEGIQAVQQIISSDGIGLHITQRHNPAEAVAAYFAVDNLQQALQELEAVGAQVVAPPFGLPVSAAASQEWTSAWRQNAPNVPVETNVGQAAIVRDPDGNLVGLTQLNYASQRYYMTGPFRRPLSADQQEANQRGRQLPTPR